MNTEKVKLSDLLPIEKWAELEEEVYRRFGLDASVYRLTGVSLTEYKQWVNPLCPVIKGNKKGLSFICAVVNQYMAQEVSQTRKPMITECDAGLSRIAIPIFVGDAFIGTFGACGKLLDENEVESFLISKTTGIDSEKIESLSSDVGRMTTEEAENAARWMETRIQEIVDAFEKTKREGTVEQT